MGLSPNKSGIEHLDSFKAFNVLEAHLKQLRRLQLTSHPWWPRVPITLAAVVQDHCLADALSNVDFGLDAVQARVRLVRLHGNAANAATDHRLLEHRLLDVASLPAGIICRLAHILLELGLFGNLRLEQHVSLVLR